jgi:hypothetical protein
VGKKLGEKIDQFDIVVRLKGCASVLGTADYGSRADALCMSTEVPGLVFNVIAGQYWFYPKNGHYDEVRTFDVVAKRGAPFMIPLDLCNHWNGKFRELEPSHQNVSTGLAAIAIAAHYYEPELIVLAGFDTLLNPDVEFTRNDAIHRTGVGPSLHDWKAENVLLRTIEKTYDTQIVSIDDVEQE